MRGARLRLNVAVPRIDSQERNRSPKHRRTIMNASLIAQNIVVIMATMALRAAVMAAGVMTVVGVFWFAGQVLSSVTAVTG